MIKYTKFSKPTLVKLGGGISLDASLLKRFTGISAAFYCSKSAGQAYRLLDIAFVGALEREHGLRLQALAKTNRAQYRKEKTQSGCATISSTYKGQRDKELCGQYLNGVIGVDMDDLEDPPAFMNALRNDPSVLYACLSTSGQGVRILVTACPTPQNHYEQRDAYFSVCRQVHERYGILPDMSFAGASNSVFFLSTDENPHCNPNAVGVYWDSGTAALFQSTLKDMGLRHGSMGYACSHADLLRVAQSGGGFTYDWAMQAFKTAILGDEQSKTPLYHKGYRHQGLLDMGMLLFDLRYPRPIAEEVLLKFRDRCCYNAFEKSERECMDILDYYYSQAGAYDALAIDESNPIISHEMLMVA